jgi:hypothetical protein
MSAFSTRTQALALSLIHLNTLSTFSRRIIGHALDTFLPELKPLLKIVNRSAREITFANGSFLRVDTSLRGGSYQIVLVSEFGKTCARSPQKAEEVITGTLQAVPSDGQIIIESTGEGNSGFYADMVNSAHIRGNENLSDLEYKLFFYPYYLEKRYREREKVSYDTDLTDYFNKIEKEANVTLDQEQRNWYALQSKILGEKIKQEFPSTISEAFLASSDAFYFAKSLGKASDEGRYLHTNPYDCLLPVYVAMDIGLNDLTVMIFFQLAHGEVRVIDYYEDKDKDVPFYAKFLRQDKEYLYHTIFLPHDSTKRDTLDINNSYERDMRRLFSGTNTRFHVLKRMDKQLSISNARLTIDRCVFNYQRVKKLIEMLGKYRKKWHEPTGRYLEDPWHDVACFVGETLIETDKGQVRIDEIAVGDMVVTPNGHRKVLNVFSYSTCSLRKISSILGSITCTPHHKIFTKKGLVNADSLQYTDVIITKNDGDVWKKLKFLGGGNSTGFKEFFLSIPIQQLSTLMDTNTQKINLVIGLEDKQVRLEDKVVCIELFGSFIMEKYLRKCIYIIKMAINLIMKSKIWKYWTQKLTQQNIILKKKKLDLDIILTFIDLKQKFGIKVKKVENGMWRMVKKLLHLKMKLIKPVAFAQSPFLLFGTLQNFAPQTVEQKEDFFQEKTTKCVNAKNVPLHLALTNIEKNKRVLSNAKIKWDQKQNLHKANQYGSKHVKYAEKNSIENTIQRLGHVREVVELNLDIKVEVYDIEVEDDHCYFANGFLVSNSDYGDSFQYLAQAVKHLELTGDNKGALERHKIATEGRARRVV